MQNDRFGQLVAENNELNEQNAHLRRVINSFESRVSALESFQSEQEKFNTGTIERVSKLQQRSGAICPGCGQPQSAGIHSVACFTTTGE